MNCQAYAGEDVLECNGDVAGRDETGTPLCEHHLAKSDVYDYPKMVDGADLKAPRSA